ncbi:hypothetical protein ACQEVB_32840 [Pseudonocardia sp. CA-107938]
MQIGSSIGLILTVVGAIGLSVKLAVMGWTRSVDAREQPLLSARDPRR